MLKKIWLKLCWNLLLASSCRALCAAFSKTWGTFLRCCVHPGSSKLLICLLFCRVLLFVRFSSSDQPNRHCYVLLRANLPVRSSLLDLSICWRHVWCRFSGTNKLIICLINTVSCPLWCVGGKCNNLWAAGITLFLLVYFSVFTSMWLSKCGGVSNKVDASQINHI